jgi:hypothetical protein
MGSPGEQFDLGVALPIAMGPRSDTVQDNSN